MLHIQNQSDTPRGQWVKARFLSEPIAELKHLGGPECAYHTNLLQSVNKSWLQNSFQIVVYNFLRILFIFVQISFIAFLQEFPLNPKALSLGELYGEFDLNTNEWTDGVMSSVMRTTCAGKWNTTVNNWSLVTPVIWPLIIIGSGNGFVTTFYQAITWTSPDRHLLDALTLNVRGPS